MTKEANDLPSAESIELAKEANRQFDPPLHVQADVTEEQFATFLAIYIEEGALVKDASGRFVVPTHMEKTIADVPILAAMMMPGAPVAGNA